MTVETYRHRWPVTVYLAGRSEDRYALRALRQVLAGLGIGCTSRWLDVDTLGVLHDPAGAQMDLDDIDGAYVFVLFSSRAGFRNTTGGKHVETGYAIAKGKPIVLIGEVENVFHGLPAVHVVGEVEDDAQLAAVIRLAASHGTPLPAAVANAS